MEHKFTHPKKGLNIVIVGCGKVGLSLVDKLSKENHDITIIDRDAGKVQDITNLFDVNGIVGNGANFSTLQEAGIYDTDILIAVTNSDELNLLCCIVAKRVTDCAVIARVRTPEYSQDAAYLKSKLGLAMIINPDLESALEISRILCLPSAVGVTPFARGLAEMIRFRIPEGNRLDGRRLRELGQELAGAVLICAVERGGEVYIPDGSFRLQAGDVVSFIAPTRGSKQFLRRIGLETHQVRDALIIGGSKTGYYLAKQLLRVGVNVELIESDRQHCEELSTQLPKAVILNGDGTDADLLREAGIEHVGAVVPLTGIDEENIMLTLHTQAVSRAKVVTKINRIMFPEAIDRLNLGSVVYPKALVTDAIVAYVRSRTASKGSSNIETLLHLFDNRVEAIEFIASEGSPVVGRPLRELPTRDRLLVACISHKGSILIPGGDDAIQPGDSVIIVTTHTGLSDLSDILA